jgi:hypothetical protein
MVRFPVIAGGDGPAHQKKSAALQGKDRCGPHADNEGYEREKDKPELGRVDERLVQDRRQDHIDGIEDRPEKKEEKTGKELILFPLYRQCNSADRNNDTDSLKEEDNKIDSK